MYLQFKRLGIYQEKQKQISKKLAIVKDEYILCYIIKIMIYDSTGIKNMIRKCIYEDNINKKIKLFFKINSLLPKESKIQVPSFITNDYINKVLYKLEEFHSIKKYTSQLKINDNHQNFLKN
ncbi:MAG: hypothetical protein ACTHKF_06215 [Candidatus Nitrosocosmicus sp.]